VRRLEIQRLRAAVLRSAASPPAQRLNADAAGGGAGEASRGAARLNLPLLLLLLFALAVLQR
jgi:hypothetical protein